MTGRIPPSVCACAARWERALVAVELASHQGMSQGMSQGQMRD